MINRVQTLLFSSTLLAAGWLVAPPAHADLKACGGIFLSGDAGCEYRPKEECMTECKTVAVEQSCVAKVYDSCETSCTTSATTECQNSCTSSCVNNCTTETKEEEGASCMDLCLADCGGDDDGDNHCGASKFRNACGRCKAHNCEKRCQDKCGDAEAPKKVTTVTECMPTCTNACSASCTAKVNTQCQVDCQESTYVECQDQMVQQCETECKQKGGAIFCDGQFVNAANADTCADELLAKLEIDIDIDASVKAVGKTTKRAANDAGDAIDNACSVSGVGMNKHAAGLGILLPLAGLAFWRIKRRRPRR
ncbi:MAG TPA: hypothetical protein VJV78_41000 [Polyangiales bacterium]|nr:hypothetical protein [Polyangiales bacterium]